MSDKNVFVLSDWVEAPPAGDYDNIDNDVNGVGAKLSQLIEELTQFCLANEIPFAAVFSAGSRNGGLESRFTSICHLFPLERVTPDVVLAAYVGTLGASKFLDNLEGIGSALEARAHHLMNLNTEE